MSEIGFWDLWERGEHPAQAEVHEPLTEFDGPIGVTPDDYDEGKPTIIVNFDPNERETVTSVQLDNWLGPFPRIVVRDWSAGSEPDEHGDIYEDREL